MPQVAAAPPGAGAGGAASPSGSGWLWAAKCLLWPIILLVQAFRIYVLGCLGVYATRLGRGLLCGLCICCCKWTYKDKSFPHSHVSLGKLEGSTPEKLTAETKWRRIGEVVAAGGKTGAKLFAGVIEPADICQGGLGDCWLLSAIACLANQDGAIQKVFLTDEYNEYGKYRLRLWDAEAAKWTTVAVDDWIPCDLSGKPKFAKPNGDEAWVLLLEKAVAKFRGNYAALDGGWPLWGLVCLSGGTGFEFRLTATKQWQCYRMSGFSPSRDDAQLNGDEMFDSLLYYNRKQSFIAAATSGGDDTKNINGIVQGHAYTVVNVKRVGSFQLVQLRNPWGTFEWSGAWSDKSPLWDENPKVKRALGFTPVDDGTFWMSWTDFCTYYNCLDFCTRDTGFDDIEIDIHEEHPCCGPTWGCVEGCAKYWLCCLGVRALFFPKRASHYVKPEATGCCGC